MKALAKLLSVEEAAEILNVSTWTVRERIGHGELKSVRVGRRVLIDPSDLDDFIQRHKE